MTVPDIDRYHTNHIEIPFQQQMLGCSKLSQEVERSREIIGFATRSASAQAIGLSNLHDTQHTKQAMANAKRKDKISSKSSIDEQYLRDINTSEGVKELLLSHSCKVVILTLKNEIAGDGIRSEVTRPSLSVE